MSKLDRTISPESVKIEHFDIREGQSVFLKNGIPIHFVNSPECEVLQLDIYFDACSKNQFFPAQATTVSALFTEGTDKYTAEEIAQNLDFYGAYVQARCTVDESKISLYCLPKHLSSCLEYILDLLYHANFPEKEINIYKQNAIQRLMVNEQRTSFLSRRAFYETIFGKENPYGASVNQQDIENISRETLTSFYREKYVDSIKYILLAGKVTDSTLSKVEDFIAPLHNTKREMVSIKMSQLAVNKIFIEKDDAMQSSIRIGKVLFNRTHPDYKKLTLLNMILGGYFGSRLMKNIREEKGLTYGIYSMMESYYDSGSFYVDVDINNELREEGITEIYKEIQRLQDQLIPEKELETAKSYMLGSFLRGFDGPFSQANYYKTIIDFKLDYGYYYDYLNVINNTSAQELKRLANEYLNIQTLTEVVVGKK